MRWLACWAMILALILGASAPVRAEEAPKIAAAADLRPALTKVAEAFRRDTGQEVILTFGSSGNFFRQIRQGAPFQMFLSADEGYALALARAGKTVDAGALYAIGRLVVVAPKGSPVKSDGGLNGLRAALARRQVRRFAIANPDHAPYGARAREALQHKGLWSALAGKLVLGENVAQALQFATAGGAQGGIVAYSLVFDRSFAARADYALLPASWHRPLRQRMVLLRGAGTTARRFYAYVQQPAARRILLSHGFALPGETG